MVLNLHFFTESQTVPLHSTTATEDSWKTLACLVASRQRFEVASAIKALSPWGLRLTECSSHVVTGWKDDLVEDKLQLVLTLMRTSPQGAFLYVWSALHCLWQENCTRACRAKLSDIQYLRSWNHLHKLLGFTVLSWCSENNVGTSALMSCLLSWYLMPKVFLLIFQILPNYTLINIKLINLSSHISRSKGTGRLSSFPWIKQTARNVVFIFIFLTFLSSNYQQCYKS